MPRLNLFARLRSRLHPRLRSRLIICAFLSTANFVQADVVYNIRLDSLEQLHVQACFKSGEVRGFRLDSPGYLTSFSDLRLNSQPKKITAGRLRLGTEFMGQDACLSYRFRLRHALGRNGERNLGTDIWRVGASILSNPGIWLLEPEGSTDYVVRFHLSVGMQVSAPWTPLDATYTSYQLSAGASGWDPQVAFGPFKNTPLTVGNAQLDVVYLKADKARSAREVSEGELMGWIERVAGHVLHSYGAFPVQRVQVLLVSVEGVEGRIARSKSAVPFARVLRRGGLAVQFFIRPSAGLEEFMDDWTATHEFSHLLIPYVRRSDGWLSEGVASYYQNVLRARAGDLSEREAWNKLYQGFERGRRADYTDTLAQSIRNDGENRTMRMYWSGAAIALMADVELRRLSRGKQSLDSVLQQLAACCLPSNRTWSGRALMQKLDDLSGHQVFMGQYQRWVNSTEFPDIQDVFHSLGISTGGGRVLLSDGGELAELRKTIMQPLDFHAW